MKFYGIFYCFCTYESAENLVGLYDEEHKEQLYEDAYKLYIDKSKMSRRISFTNSEGVTVASDDILSVSDDFWEKTPIITNYKKPISKKKFMEKFKETFYFADFEYLKMYEIKLNKLQDE